jgi:poly(A) polymerase/tRNA nucleotidyltransferase (CCA-adding enzyme)
VISFPGIDALWDALPEARIAGGAVRDTLLGRAVSDVDFATPLLPETVQTRLQNAGIKTIPTGLAHGTVTAIVGGRGFEITTLRRDIATDGRHATVAFTDDWKEDASRRDFTINAMSADRTGTIFDYFGGQADLVAGHVRFVGDPALRIAEDYLRILRFFRFFARYAKDAPDPDAIAAITTHRDGIATLSAERIWSELKLLLHANDPRQAIALMQDTGVLALVLPAHDISRFNKLIAHGAPPDALLRLAALLTEDVPAFAARLKLSGAEQERLLSLSQPNALTPASDDATLRRALADEDHGALMDRTWLAQNDAPGWDELRARIAATPRPVFPLQGRDITAAGIPPGPRVGEILHEIRTWWLAGGCIANRQACLEKLPP